MCKSLLFSAPSIYALLLTRKVGFTFEKKNRQEYSSLYSNIYVLDVKHREYLDLVIFQWLQFWIVNYVSNHFWQTYQFNHKNLQNFCFFNTWSVFTAMDLAVKELAASLLIPKIIPFALKYVPLCRWRKIFIVYCQGYKIIFPFLSLLNIKFFPLYHMHLNVL